MSKRRVVVTGLGLVTPLGSSVDKTWQGLLSGKSGVTQIDAYDVSTFPVQIAATVRDFNVEDYLSAKLARKMDTFMQYGMAAGIQAVADSGLTITEDNADRVGVAIGSGIGGLPLIEHAHKCLTRGGPRKVSPFFIPGAIINMVSGNLSIHFGAKGPNIAMSTACTTGLHCIGDAARMIAYGDADAMIAGGAEMASSPLGIAGFAAARALSTRNGDPQGASRPWDKGRDGFVLGDGAGAVVLESYDTAVKRGARIYAEVAGYGMSGDAFHMTAPPEDGQGAAAAMKNALRDAQLNPETIGYINAHGTSTLVGDIAETRAIKTAFGGHAKQLAVSSTKSMLGHLLGAAGAVESVISLLALRHQVAPPTINIEEQDEQCDLDYVPWTARDLKLDAVLSNSFGFGGTNGSLIFTKLT